MFTDAADIKTTVKRCPKHSHPDNLTNVGFEYPQHLIRFHSPDAIYCEDLESGIMSVITPLGKMKEGASLIPLLLKFMCLGSDVGGINRRPLQMIFTLEEENRNVIGRQTVDVKVCCCPKRDKTKDEERWSRTNKREETRASRNEHVLLVPVHKDDVQKIDEFAGAAWICREPNEMEEIKETRRFLHKQVY